MFTAPVSNVTPALSNAALSNAVLSKPVLASAGLSKPVLPTSEMSAEQDFPISINSPISISELQFQEFQQKRAALLKHVAGLERLAEVKPASRLEIRPKPEMISSGVTEVDAITGGIPRGCLTEIWGGASSGKTSVMLAAISAATRRGETCVLIDASDSFDPASAEAAGVNFGKLLWVRCGDTAIKNLNHRGHRGTQGKTKHSEHRLEQVLKATDLILQSGGFGMIVLDMAGVAEKFVRRIPLASWFRFQRVVEHTESALLVVSESGCAQTCATLGIRMGKQSSAVSCQRSGKPEHAELLEGMRTQAEIMRSRLERKPAQSVRGEFITQAVRLG